MKWKKSFTFGHKILVVYNGSHVFIQGRLGRVERLTVANYVAIAKYSVEIVCQSDAVARLYLQYLMFAIAVESCPLDGRSTLFRLGPVEGCRFAPVSHF